jgi:hypothetical protein
MVATLVLLLTHVPPPGDESVIADPAQTAEDPLMAVGRG